MYDNIDLLIFLNNICANKYAYWSDKVIPIGQYIKY